MKRVFLTSAAVALVALALTLPRVSHARPAANQQEKQAVGYQVKIDNFSFGPATLTVPAGATVTWINQDDVPHTVVSTDGKGIKSSVLDTDDKFAYTFKKPGSYAYYCSVHPRMTGKVIVK